MNRTLTAIVAAVALTTLLAAPAAGVLKGQPDFAHEYVGLLDDGNFACTGSLIAPTVVITAGHCFSDIETFPSAYGFAPDGAPIVEVTFAQQGFFDPNAIFHFGAYYWDPEFCLACGAGLKGFDTHDVAVVILFEPVPTSEVDSYAALPGVGTVDSLPNQAPIDVVGYGVQHFALGGGPCFDADGNHVPCTPTPDAFFTRMIATARLVQAEHVVSAEFIKINAAHGGACFGDSGGPDLLGGTNMILAINSFGTNGRCNGVAYSYRIDTAAALDFIAEVIATKG